MAKGQWVTVQIEDEEISYKYEAHSIIPLKNTPWLYCKYCGLLVLKNKFSQWCYRMGCLNEYHNQYSQMLLKFTNTKV